MQNAFAELEKTGRSEFASLSSNQFRIIYPPGFKFYKISISKISVMNYREKIPVNGLIPGIIFLKQDIPDLQVGFHRYRPSA